MKKFFLLSMFVVFYSFASISHTSAVACNPSNPDDLSGVCSKAIRCENNITHTSQGCYLGPICGAPEPEPCGGGSTGGANTTPVQTQTQTVAPVTMAPLGANNPNVIKSHATCVQGTEFSSSPYGDGVVYTGCYNFDHVFINTCSGTETTGLCAPQRIDPVAAAAVAAATGPGCKAVENSLGGGIDRTTGLGYFYSVSCPGDSGSGTTGGTSGTGKPTTGGTAGTGSGTGSATATAASSQVKQQIIDSLKNLIAGYTRDLQIAQGQVSSGAGTVAIGGNNASATGVCSVNQDLRIGDSNTDVTTLTKVLVANGLLASTQSIFDQNVFDAVVKYQEKYASSILSPVGLTRGTGFVGPSTRNYIASHETTCTILPVPAQTGGTPVTGTSTGTTLTSTKAGRFSYTFVKLSNSTWKITLDNPALGTPSDHSYIPANASITATSAQDLNIQSQARYNTPSYFPGTAVGNTFYADVFGAFIAAYYDWTNQVAKAPLVTVTPVVPPVVVPPVSSTPDFTFTLSPQIDTPQNIARNPIGNQVSTVAYTLTITPQGGFTGDVTVSMLSVFQGLTGGIVTGDSSSPYAYTKTFSFTSANPQSVQFLVHADANSPIGLYTMGIVANAKSNNQLSHTVTVLVNVQ